MQSRWLWSKCVGTRAEHELSGNQCHFGGQVQGVNIVSWHGYFKERSVHRAIWRLNVRLSHMLVSKAAISAVSQSLWECSWDEL